MSHRFLYRPPPANHPALLRAVMVRSLAPVPPVVDLRGFCQAIRDQGQEGCCSGFATAAARELVWAKEAGLSAVSYLSPAYLYARTRMTEGTFPHDSGATIVDEVSTLTNYGTCPEIDLPYTANPAEAPTPQDDVQAAPFRCGTPQRVGTPFTYTITATNSPSSYGASSLPSWASRTGAVISGTPTTVSGSPFSSTVSATNIYGTGSHGLTITVNPETLTAVTITGPFLATGSPLTPTYTTTPSGGTVAFTPSTETAAGTYSLAWSGTGDYTGSGTTSWTIQPVASSLTAHGAVSLP